LKDTTDSINARKGRLPYVDWSEFVKLRFAPPDINATQLSGMVQFLNDVGVVNWFPAVKDIIILDCKWLATLMSSLISFTSRWQNGIVKYSHILQSWKVLPAIPVEKYESLIKLLEQFEILFPYPDSTTFIDHSFPPVDSQFSFCR